MPPVFILIFLSLTLRNLQPILDLTIDKLYIYHSERKKTFDKLRLTNNKNNFKISQPQSFVIIFNLLVLTIIYGFENKNPLLNEVVIPNICNNEIWVLTHPLMNAQSGMISSNFPHEVVSAYLFFFLTACCLTHRSIYLTIAIH